MSVGQNAYVLGSLLLALTKTVSIPLYCYTGILP